MINLQEVAHNRGKPDFNPRLKAAVERLSIDDLPLLQAMSNGNQILEQPLTAMVNAVGDEGGRIVADVGIFFACLDAGNCCADDPTPVEPHDEYCVLRFSIDPESGDAEVTLAED